MEQLPAIFISHGAPDLPIRTGATQTFLTQLGQSLPKPKAILAISAHWNSQTPTVSRAIAPRTIHDFSGFERSLYELTYPVAGAPALAEQVVELMQQSNMTCETTVDRGLDHGVWTPLMLMYSQADIPVTQISIQFHQTPDYHYKLGQALQPLRASGILIVASGGATHNLAALGAGDRSPPSWVTEFDQWLAKAVEEQEVEKLLNYRELAPFAVQNHPTDEHLLPLFVAMGAGGQPMQQIHAGYTYNVLSMAAYAFGDVS